MRRCSAKPPGNRTGNQHHCRHRAARLSQFTKIQAESAFEQDYSHRQFDDRFLQRAEIAFRIDNAQNGAGDYADNQHQCDGGTTGPPGNPLRADAEQADQRNLDH